METTRYLDCLAADYGLLRDAASPAGLDQPVPSCPGWTAADLVIHVGEVYLHKAATMREQKWPEPWPPDDLPSGPLAVLDRGWRELTVEFARREPEEPSLTWYGPDQTVGFWIRRMAQETVVHRMDAQLAVGVPLTKVPDDLAIDGVDEVLKRFLGYGSVEWPQEYATVKGGHLADAAGTGTIVVTAGPAAWTVRPTPASVSVADVADVAEVAEVAEGADSTGSVDSAPKAEVSAGPDAMLRWLWGRAGDEAVTVAGDPAWAAYLRRLLAAVTG